MRNYRRKIYVIKTKNDELLFSSLQKLDNYVMRHRYLEKEENKVYVEYINSNIVLELTFENLKK